MTRLPPTRVLAVVLCLATMPAIAAAMAGASLDALIRDADTKLREGQFQTAAQLIDAAQARAAANNDADSAALVAALRANLNIAFGRAEGAATLASQALAQLATTDPAPRAASMLWNALGTSRGLLGDADGALAAFQKAEQSAAGRGDMLAAAQALGNAARSRRDAGFAGTSFELAKRAHGRLASVPDGPDKTFMLVNLGRTVAGLTGTAGHRETSFQWYGEALALAKRLDNTRLQSFALGYQAELYEAEHRPQEALLLFRRAALLAQQVLANDVLYLWESGAGRVEANLGNYAAAHAAYRRAVDLLENLRHQLPFAYGERGAFFERSVEPVYFGLVDAQLKSAAAAGDPAAQQVWLNDARHTVERFKAAELRNYFGDDCVDRARSAASAGSISANTIVVYPIPLGDRLELLLSLPGNRLTRATVPVTAERLEADLLRFRQLLEKRTTREFITLSKALYRTLIGSWREQLPPNVDTLVFVPYGSFNMVPLAALHDGQQFLIERFRLAVVPGLDLTDPQPLQRERLKLLVAGLSESVDGYPALGHVPAEVQRLSALADADTLVDKDFNLAGLSKALSSKPYNVLHIATHGDFGEETEQSFLLTYDGRMAMADLEDYVGLFRYRDDPLQLLTLSACDTASGGTRAALGLSGIAVKAGARSALGTLWRVNDQAAALLTGRFYESLLRPGISRAQALQDAQLALASDPRYWHPGYWSAFLLISNWL